MNTPTSKVEALREELDGIAKNLSTWQGYRDEALKTLPEDTRRFVDDASWAGEELEAARLKIGKARLLQAFATFLESLGSQAETFSKDGKPLSDTNSIESVPVSALHQVVTALRGGNSVRNGGQG